MSSFRKRNVKQQLPFTRTSPQTGQLITSSGNPSLDVLLGGGLPIGSICLIEEDKFSVYSKILSRYFMAEGVCSGQSVFLGSLDDDPEGMLKRLPQPLSEYEAKTEETETPTDQNGLRIAWRYNDLPMVNSEKTNTPLGHQFNLMKMIPNQMLLYAKTVTWCDDDAQDNDIVVTQDSYDNDGEDEIAHYNNENDATYVMDSSKENNIENLTTGNNGIASEPSSIGIGMDNMETSAPPPPAIVVATEPTTSGEAETPAMTLDAAQSAATPASSLSSEKEEIFKNPKYCRLLKKIQKVLRDDKFNSRSVLTKKSLCRVCLTSLASPRWYDDHYDEDLLKFLTILRATIRNSVSVCFITMPMHLVAKYDDTLVYKIRNLVDYAIEMESFAASDKETNPAFKEYNGLIHLRKITAINTLSAYMPETTDLAFKLRRTKFCIEKLHLPPELQEENDKTTSPIKPTLSCGSNTSPNTKITMDF